jgi:hypothetical protein
MWEIVLQGHILSTTGDALITNYMKDGLLWNSVEEFSLLQIHIGALYPGMNY